MTKKTLSNVNKLRKVVMEATATSKPAKKAGRKTAKTPSMFDALLGILTLADCRFRTWKLRKWEGLQEYDGNIIVIGAPSDEGPYVQFCFDDEGTLQECTTVNDVEGVGQTCIDNIAGITRRYLDYATHKTTTTPIKEN